MTFPAAHLQHLARRRPAAVDANSRASSTRAGPDGRRAAGGGRGPTSSRQLAARTGMREGANRSRGSRSGFLSRGPVVHAHWHRPRFSRQCLRRTVVPQDVPIRIFGRALERGGTPAWTERRRLVELRAAAAERDLPRTRTAFHVLGRPTSTHAGRRERISTSGGCRRGCGHSLWLSGRTNQMGGRFRRSRMRDTSMRSARSHPGDGGLHDAGMGSSRSASTTCSCRRHFANRVAGIEVVPRFGCGQRLRTICRSWPDLTIP